VGPQKTKEVVKGSGAGGGHTKSTDGRAYPEQKPQVAGLDDGLEPGSGRINCSPVSTGEEQGGVEGILGSCPQGLSQNQGRTNG